MLERRGIPHHVLNAKQHAREAQIVAQAGRLHAVTVATNMAGRGVDILLGGNPEVLAAQEVRGVRARPRVRGGPGPLRRAAGQVRARSARPRATRSASSADSTCSAPSATSPAASTTSCGADPAVRATRARRRFFLSLEDELMRLFATGRHELGDGPGPARGRADRLQDGDQGHRAGPEHRRGPQRRDPQGRPQVRRGHERAAQGDLRPAPPDPRGRGPAGPDHRGALSAPSTASSTANCGGPTSRRTGTSTACSREIRLYFPTESPSERAGRARRHRRPSTRPWRPRPSTTTSEREQPCRCPGGDRTPCGPSSAR